MLKKSEDIFKQMDISKEKRDKWNEVLQFQYMSSEDTEDESTLAVWPLPWLTEKVEKFKATLDGVKTEKMSAQSKCQAKKKVKGRYSTRPKPSGGSAWIYKTTTGVAQM